MPHTRARNRGPFSPPSVTMRSGFFASVVLSARLCTPGVASTPQRGIPASGAWGRLREGPLAVRTALPRTKAVVRQARSVVGQSDAAAASTAGSTAGEHKVTRLNHIAIAVPCMAEAVERYKSILGCKVSDPQPEPDHGVTVVFVELANTKIELLEPLGEESPIANFLKKNKDGGIHHICVEVSDIHGSVAGMKERGVRLLNEKPKIGAHKNPVVFIHPKDTNGTLLEFEEVPPAA